MTEQRQQHAHATDYKGCNAATGLSTTDCIIMASPAFHGNVDHGIADSDDEEDDDSVLDVVDNDGAVLIPVAEVEAAAILENVAAAADAAGGANVVPNNSHLNSPHPPFPPPPNPLGLLTRTWTTTHCGELMQDARLPVYSQFNRLASFRFCPISATRKMDLAGKGWYCSGVNHELRCAFCWRQIGACHKIGITTIEIFHAQRHHCDGRMSQHDADNLATLNPGYPALIDPLQDSLEYCMTPPASSLRDMSSYATRFVSYCNPYWPTRLWGMASSLAMAGFYFKRGFPALARCFYCNVQVEVRGNDVDPWVGHVQASATCAYVINTRGIRFVNDVCSILREHPATLYRGLESKPALLRRIAAHWPDYYGHAEVVLDLNVKNDVIWSYETLLERVEERKQTLINEAALRDAERAQLANGNEETLRNILRCKVCLDNQSAVFFEPCQHVCTCGPCGTALNHCPVCRQLIRERKEIFLS